MLQLLQGHKKEEVYVFLSFQIVCQKVSVALSVRLLDSSFPSASTWAAYGRIKIAQCGCSPGAGWEHRTAAWRGPRRRPRGAAGPQRGRAANGHPSVPDLTGTGRGTPGKGYTQKGLGKERDRYTAESAETGNRERSQASFCRIFLRR